MKYATLDASTYALRLEPGEDLHAVIHEFSTQQGITNASVQGIGSVESPTLAHYSIETKQFTDKPLEGIYEIASLLGNVAVVDDRPLAHIHVTLSDSDMRTCGGHLVRGECSATVELIITSYPSQHRKTHDDTIGLKVWDFEAR